MALEAKLAQFVADSAEQLAKVQGERDEYRKLVLHLREENERLKRGLLGQKAERLPRNDAQLTLAILAMAMGGPRQQVRPRRHPSSSGRSSRSTRVASPSAGHLRKTCRGSNSRSSRRRWSSKAWTPSSSSAPSDAPCSSAAPLPTSWSRSCTRSSCARRARRRSRSARQVRPSPRRRRRRRTASDDSDGAPGGDAQERKVLVGETVELPIERGSAGPGLLADTIVRRWQDHQPLHRLEGIYGREGLELSRSTVCTWHLELATLCRPLVEVMFADALTAPYVCVDATGVLVLAKERCRTGHFWVLVAPERHVLYRYSKEHNGKAVDKLLPGYAGYLVADAHSVYDHLFRRRRCHRGRGCWAHCRRYGFKALGSDPERAKVMLTHIGALFAIERTIRRRSPLEEAGRPAGQIQADRRGLLPVVRRAGWACPRRVAHRAGHRLRPQPAAGARAVPRRRRACPCTITSPSWACAGKFWADAIGCFWAATTEVKRTPCLSRCSPAAACTTSSRSPTCGISCACCPVGPSTACSRSRPSTGARPWRKNRLRRPLDANVFRRVSLGLPLRADHHPGQLHASGQPAQNG